jgi:hypothetical protein
MNREHAQKKTGTSADVIKAAEKLMSQGTPLETPTIPEGTKVKINVDKIFKEKGFADRMPRFRKFVQEARDKIFTVEYDPEHRDRPTLVCLKEDPSEVKWLWYIGDLEVVE